MTRPAYSIHLCTPARYPTCYRSERHAVIMRGPREVAISVGPNALREAIRIFEGAGR